MRKPKILETLFFFVHVKKKKNAPNFGHAKRKREPKKLCEANEEKNTYKFGAWNAHERDKRDGEKEDELIEIG